MAEPTINGFPIKPGLVVSLRSSGTEWWTVQSLIPPTYDFWGKVKTGWRVSAVQDHHRDGYRRAYFPPEVLQCLKPGWVMKAPGLDQDDKEAPSDPEKIESAGDGEK